jgi:tetratricopeptide (TPR) repeat protein
MDEEQIEGQPLAEAIAEAPGADGMLDTEEPLRAGSRRWLRQFAVGAVVTVVLVVALGKRAELSSTVALTQARRDMQDGHSFRAARALELANHDHPGDRAVQVALIEAYYRAGEPEQARHLQNQVVFTPDEEKRIQPLVDKVESTAEELQTGADLLRQNQFLQALPVLQHAVKDMPDSPLTHAYLVKAYAGLYVTRLKPEDLQSCRQEQSRLQDIDPALAAQTGKPLSRLEVLPEVIKHTDAADAALKAGKTEAAVPELDAADRLYPNSAMVHVLRAIVHAQRFEKTGAAEEKRQALEEYQTAIQLNPTRASMRSRLGKLAKEAGD